jgi:hypothetical protein
MDALHCGSADVESDAAFYGMTYYTQHSEIDDHHYLCLDVPAKTVWKY